MHLQSVRFVRFWISMVPICLLLQRLRMQRVSKIWIPSWKPAMELWLPEVIWELRFRQRRFLIYRS